MESEVGYFLPATGSTWHAFWKISIYLTVRAAKTPQFQRIPRNFHVPLWFKIALGESYTVL